MATQPPNIQNPTTFVKENRSQDIIQGSQQLASGITRTRFMGAIDDQKAALESEKAEIAALEKDAEVARANLAIHDAENPVSQADILAGKHEDAVRNGFIDTIGKAKKAREQGIISEEQFDLKIKNDAIRWSHRHPADAGFFKSYVDTSLSGVGDTLSPAGVSASSRKGKMTPQEAAIHKQETRRQEIGIGMYNDPNWDSDPRKVAAVNRQMALENRVNNAKQIEPHTQREAAYKFAVTTSGGISELEKLRRGVTDQSDPAFVASMRHTVNAMKRRDKEVILANAREGGYDATAIITDMEEDYDVWFTAVEEGRADKISTQYKTSLENNTHISAIQSYPELARLDSIGMDPVKLQQMDINWQGASDAYKKSPRGIAERKMIDRYLNGEPHPIVSVSKGRIQNLLGDDGKIRDDALVALQSTMDPNSGTWVQGDQETTKTQGELQADINDLNNQAGIESGGTRQEFVMGIKGSLTKQGRQAAQFRPQSFANTVHGNLWVGEQPITKQLAGKAATVPGGAVVLHPVYEDGTVIVTTAGPNPKLVTIGKSDISPRQGNFGSAGSIASHGVGKSTNIKIAEILGVEYREQDFVAARNVGVANVPESLRADRFKEGGLLGAAAQVAKDSQAAFGILGTVNFLSEVAHQRYGGEDLGKIWLDAQNHQFDDALANNIANTMSSLEINGGLIATQSKASKQTDTFIPHSGQELIGMLNEMAGAPQAPAAEKPATATQEGGISEEENLEIDRQNFLQNEVEARGINADMVMPQLDQMKGTGIVPDQVSGKHYLFRNYKFVREVDSSELG